MKFINNKSSIKGLWIYVGLIVFLMLVVFLLFSSMFERNAPKIKVQNEIYWNFQNPINVVITDDTKIKSYEIVFVDGDYAADGTYWGKTDVPLWCAFSDNNRIYVHASTRSNAISLVQKTHPDLQFYKK